MNLKVLLTIDLPGASDEKRKAFYESLEENQWFKIDDLSTTWEASFGDEVLVENAQKIVVKDLKDAKKISKVKHVNYAFHVGWPDVQQGQLSLFD